MEKNTGKKFVAQGKLRENTGNFILARMWPPCNSFERGKELLWCFICSAVGWGFVSVVALRRMCPAVAQFCPFYALKQIAVCVQSVKMCTAFRLYATQTNACAAISFCTKLKWYWLFLWFACTKYRRTTWYSKPKTNPFPFLLENLENFLQKNFF